MNLFHPQNAERLERELHKNLGTPNKLTKEQLHKNRIQGDVFGKRGASKELMAMYEELRKRFDDRGIFVNGRKMPFEDLMLGWVYDEEKQTHFLGELSVVCNGDAVAQCTASGIGIQQWQYGSREWGNCVDGQWHGMTSL